MTSPPREHFMSLPFLAKVKICIATVLGIGFVPKMPGTLGSAIVLPAVVFIPDISYLYLLALAFGSFVLGLWAVPFMEERNGDDPPCVVIDEVAGMALTLASPVVPHSPVWIACAFALFRLFDIVKPFPVNMLNARNGALFVMFDDILAAFYALLGLHLLWLISQLFFLGYF